MIEHPLRALFFQQPGPYGDSSEAEGVAEEEEVRGGHATLALGPDHQRYVVGFDRDTWRVIGERGERIGRAGEGWSVFDSSHRVVRRGPERLWAGWHRWLLLQEDDGGLVRLDLSTDERERLGAPERAIDACLVLPGTANFLLVRQAEDGLRVRLT